MCAARGMSKSCGDSTRSQRDRRGQRSAGSCAVVVSHYRTSHLAARASHFAPRESRPTLRQVLEARVFLDEGELAGADGAVALFADDDFGGALRLLVHL